MCFLRFSASLSVFFLSTCLNDCLLIFLLFCICLFACVNWIFLLSFDPLTVTVCIKKLKVTIKNKQNNVFSPLDLGLSFRLPISIILYYLLYWFKTALENLKRWWVKYFICRISAIVYKRVKITIVFLHWLKHMCIAYYFKINSSFKGAHKCKTLKDEFTNKCFVK